MAVQLSELEKNIRSRIANEKRFLDDFDRVLREAGLVGPISKQNLSFEKLKQKANFFQLDQTREIDERLKKAFEFCGLNEEEPRHWRVLLNALVMECFPKRGRRKKWDQEGLFELAWEIREVQAAHPKLTEAKDIAKKLLRISRFTKKYPSINSVGSLTKLVRKARNEKPYAERRGGKDVPVSAMRNGYFSAETVDEGVEKKVGPVPEILMAVAHQRVLEENLVEHLKGKYPELSGSALSWEAEQQLRRIAKETLEMRLREVS
jgi:hypothetical protein